MRSCYISLFAWVLVHFGYPVHVWQALLHIIEINFPLFAFVPVLDCEAPWADGDALDGEFLYRLEDF